MPVQSHTDVCHMGGRCSLVWCDLCSADRFGGETDDELIVSLVFGDICFCYQDPNSLKLFKVHQGQCVPCREPSCLLYGKPIRLSRLTTHNAAHLPYQQFILRESLSEEFLTRCDGDIAKLDLENDPLVEETRATERITGAEMNIRMTP